MILDGRLGRVWRVHSRMDQGSAQTLAAGPTGGLLRDFGSHVVDQMVYLLGPVTSVHATMEMVERPEGATDACFALALRHECGATSHLSVSKLNHIDARERRAYGDLGCYLSQTTDVQAQHIFAGKRPVDDFCAWGHQPTENRGTLFTPAGKEAVPSERGRYHDYQEAFALAVRDGTQPPVTAKTGARTLAVLDAARASAVEGRSIEL